MKHFIKTKEDFTCDKCGNINIGNGYTNHCRECLWSKHVDIAPGDRKSLCQGLMEPQKVEGSTGGSMSEDYRILHKCIVCGYEKINRLMKGDSEIALFAIIKKNSDKLAKI